MLCFVHRCTSLDPSLSSDTFSSRGQKAICVHGLFMGLDDQVTGLSRVHLHIFWTTAE